MAAPSIATTSSGSGVSITYPAGLAVGDLLVVFVQASGTSSAGGKTAPTVSALDNNGKIYVHIDGSQGSATSGAVVKVSALLSRVWDSTEGTLSCFPSFLSSPTFTWVCWRIPGGIADVKASSLQATGTTFSFPSVTTTGPDRLILLAGMAGTPTTAIDTATISGATNVDGARSGTTIAGRVWSFTQAVAGATGAKTSSTVASSGSVLDAYTVAIKAAAVGVTVDLSGAGVAASPAAGTLTIKSAVSVNPSGVAASPAAGILAAKGGARGVPTGVAAAPVAGTLTARGGARATPTGVATSPAAGTPAITLRIIVTPTGVAASPAVGNLTARGGARAAPTGVAASPAAGSPIATGGARLTLASVAADPAAGDVSTFGVFDSRFILSPDKAGQYLIEITAYQAVGTSGGVAAISEIPVGALPRGAAAGGGQITLRYADVDWIGDPADAWQPNVQYDGRVALPLHAERLAPLYPEESRRVQRQFGAIEFMNSDGALDNIIRSFGVGGRAVRVLFGPYMESYSEFSLIASMVAVGWQAGEDTVRLELRDLSNILAQPLQANLYAGTGGVEGTTDIAGKPKPLFFGECDNVTPTLVDPLNLIYQAHDGAMQAIDAVYDRGGALTLDTSVGTGGDVADYAALVASTVGASKFATCLAEGFIKLGSSPAGIVTVTGKGDKTGGVYSDTLDVIALRIIMARGGVDSASVDATSFATLASFGGPVCLYVSSGETPSGADLVDRLVASVGGWWGSTRGGRIEAGRLKAPETAPVDRYIDQYDILSIQPEPAPVVRWRHRVGWGRNWTVQTGDLDVTVSDARRQFLRSADRVATASDGGLLTSHASAVDAPLVETLLVNEADATTVAAYLQALFGVERSIYRITVKRLGYLMKHGDVLHITYPRFDMTSGKKFIVIGIAEDAGSEEIELRVWG